MVQPGLICFNLAEAHGKTTVHAGRTLINVIQAVMEPGGDICLLVRAGMLVIFKHLHQPVNLEASITVEGQQTVLQVVGRCLQSLVEKVYAIVVLLIDKCVGQMSELLNIIQEMALNGHKSRILLQCLVTAQCG